MYRRDYIQQQLEEFGKFLSKLAGYKTNKRFEDLEAETEIATKHFIGKSLQEITAFKEQQLVSYAYGLESSQKKILARLLFERMLLCDELGQELEANTFAKKSLLVYQLLNNDQTASEFDLDTHYKLEILNARILR